MHELDRWLTTVFALWHTPCDSVVAPFAQVWDFVEMNFEPLLALLGGSARSACIGRLRRGHQVTGVDHPSSRARPPLPRRCVVPTAQGLPPPRVPQTACGTPACAAHAAHACMHPIPTALRHPCSPRCPSFPHISCSLRRTGKARRKPPPTHVPCAAPPCRQVMNLDSIVAYDSRINRWCGATRGGFSFSRSFFRSQMCRVGRRRHRPWGRRAARSAIFLLFLRGRVLCESNNMIELHNPLCTRTHGTHVPRRVISHRCTHTP